MSALSLPVPRTNTQASATPTLAQRFRFFGVHAIERVLGEAILRLGRGGDGDAAPLVCGLLTRLGLFQRDPRSWPLSPRLQGLEAGSVPIEARPHSLPAGFDGPWPQAPVVDERLCPPVLHLLDEHRQDHRDGNVSRYLGQLVLTAPRAAWESKLGNRVEVPEDPHFAHLLSNTLFAQLLSRTLSPRDRTAFQAILSASPSAEFRTIDCSAIEDRPTLPGIFAPGTVVLLEKTAHRVFTPRAIRVRDRVFVPDGGAGWHLAKLYTMQALSIQIVGIRHVCRHFPVDVINAVSQTLLPAGHVLAHLLRPHTDHTLGLHVGVIHHRRSSIFNSQRELYTPFPFPDDQMVDNVALGLHGDAQHPAHEPYTFGSEHLDRDTLYGCFFDDWRRHFETFVSAAVATIPDHDPHVRAWADAIAPWLPGFPDGTAIADRSRLVDAITTYMVSVSVYHTGDHFSFAGIPTRFRPWRVRHAPLSPGEPEPDHLDIPALVSPEDHFRHVLCNAMFFEPVVRSNLANARYGFARPGLSSAESAFRAGFADLDHRWGPHGFARSWQVACGVQY